MAEFHQIKCQEKPTSYYRKNEWNEDKILIWRKDKRKKIAKNDCLKKSFYFCSPKRGSAGGTAEAVFDEA